MHDFPNLPQLLRIPICIVAQIIQARWVRQFDLLLGESFQVPIKCRIRHRAICI
jgi:hypothetical protein